ncbi:zonadhesin-like [Arctopsyche grandis]|uniref:zonadhesin-like n=1 Tax=Arctopsyche grandis TaxID=121162 RepID=UPI00406D6F89
MSVGSKCWKQNEVLDWYKCEKSCDNPNPKCPEWRQPGCTCKSGYLRDPWTGECVLPSQCSNVCTGPNEVFSPCSKSCEKTCDNDDPICSTVCKPGCICKEGYVRDTTNGKCVLRQQCSGGTCPRSFHFYFG